MKNLPVRILVLSLVVVSCNKKPEAKFSPSPQEPLLGEEVSFNNTSQDGQSFLWDFGDGSNSEEKSPKHAYAAEGNYQVTLTAYSNGKKKWSKLSVPLTVKHPTALFTGDVDGQQKKLYNGVNGDALKYTVAQTTVGTNKERIYDAAIGQFGSGQEHFGVKLGTLTVPSAFTLADIHPLFYAMVEVSYYSFSPAALSGVVVYYKASNGVIWASDAGTADQTGSTFVITYAKNDVIGSDKVKRFKAHVNCKVYNGLGQSKTITNGIFELAFGDI